MFRRTMCQVCLSSNVARSRLRKYHHVSCTSGLVNINRFTIESITSSSVLSLTTPSSVSGLLQLVYRVVPPCFVYFCHMILSLWSYTILYSSRCQLYFCFCPFNSTPIVSPSCFIFSTSTGVSSGSVLGCNRTNSSQFA